MLNIFLNIIGLILIIISIIFIKETSKKEIDIYEEILLIEDNIKFYSLIIEETLNNFDELMDSSLYKLETLEKQNNSDKNIKIPMEECSPSGDSHSIVNKILLEEDNINNNYTDTIYDEIIKLNKMGLKSEEIAKKLNIGIREVEIFLKMYDNK